MAVIPNLDDEGIVRTPNQLNKKYVTLIIHDDKTGKDVTVNKAMVDHILVTEQEIVVKFKKKAFNRVMVLIVLD